MAGPALGGLLYGFRGPALAYAVVSVLTAISLAGVALIGHTSRPAPSGTTVIESVKIGLRFRPESFPI